MPSRDRELICQLLSSLLAPPDRERVEQVRTDQVLSFLKDYVKSQGGNGSMVNGLAARGTLSLS